MRTALFALAFGAGMSVGVVSAEAMPAVYVEGAGPATGTPAITLAAEGCGIGEHRGPLGHCRPNEAPRVCPRGSHLGPQGRDCIRN